MRLYGWFFLAVTLVAQVVGLYSPAAPGPDGVPGLDKIGHLLAFGVPTALAWLLGGRWLVPVLVLHAVVSEPLQHLLAPGRQLDWWDAVANLAGVVVGVLVGVVAVEAWRRRGHDGGMPSHRRAAQSARQEGSR